MRHFEASTDAARDRHMREMMSFSPFLSLQLGDFSFPLSLFRNGLSDARTCYRGRLRAKTDFLPDGAPRRARRPSWRLSARWRRVARRVHLRFIFLIFPLQGGETVNFVTLSVILIDIFTFPLLLKVSFHRDRLKAKGCVNAASRWMG